MEDQFLDILKSFYSKLQNIILREEVKLKNSSVLWTLIQVNSKTAEKYIDSSSYSNVHFASEHLNYLENSKFLRHIQTVSNPEGYVLTAKGIWEVEKIMNNISDERLLEFIQDKYLTFEIKQKPIDDKDKLAIFSLLCIRGFSIEVAMDLYVVKHREGWNEIFEKAYDFLRSNNYFKNKYNSFSDITSSSGSEHLIQNLMRHRNDLSIKSGQIFCNPGKSKFYLDVAKDGVIDIKKLKFAFKLVFTKIEDLTSANFISNFCIEMANDMSKYVITDYQFIDSKTDSIIKDAVRQIYIG